MDGPILVHGKLRPMLCFLSLTPPELAAPNPPQRDAFASKPENAGEPENQETLDADACDDAAFYSLELAREQGSLPTRLVVSFEVHEGRLRMDSWGPADSIFVDDQEGRALCADLVGAQTQAEADVLLEELHDEPLMWFDASERLDLVRHLLKEGAA